MNVSDIGTHACPEAVAKYPVGRGPQKSPGPAPGAGTRPVRGGLPAAEKSI